MKHLWIRWKRLTFLCLTGNILLFFLLLHQALATGRRPYPVLDHDFPYIQCSLRVIDADIRDVLEAFAEKYKLNMVMSEDVKGTISIIVNDVPVREAFQNILRYSNLGYVKEENIYRIKPIKELIEEEHLNQKVGSLETEVIPLRYANAERLVGNLSKFKSNLDGSVIDADKWTNSIIIKDTAQKIEEIKRVISRLDSSTPAKEIQELTKVSKIVKLHYINCNDIDKIEALKDKVSTHPQTNSVIITDLPENIAHLASIIEGLDQPIRQILIEAKIVETNKSYSNLLGIQWGGHYSANPPSGKSFPTVSVGGALGGEATMYNNTPANFAVNLPGPAGNPYGSLDVVIGHLKDKVALNLRLSAMEDSGNGRIISQPRIMTLDNTQATISSGETIQLPSYRALSSTTIVTGEGGTNEGGTEKEAKTALIVTPHIISDNQIKLKICINRDTPDYSRQVNDVPVINTRQADTELIVAHGETAVIGGLATSGITDKSERIPWLSQIPLLGWLFKSKAKISEYGELLVFITPHIIEASDYTQKTE